MLEPSVIIEIENGSPRKVDWAPDSRTLAIGTDDGSVLIWENEQSTFLRQFGDHLNSIRDVEWSPQGGRLAAVDGDDGALIIWDAAGGNQLWMMNGSFQYISWSPDGTELASAAGDDGVLIFDAETGDVAQAIEGHGNIRSVAWSPDGDLLAFMAADRIVVIWDMRVDEEQVSAEYRPGNLASDIVQPRNVVAWTPSGDRLAVGGRGLRVMLMNPVSGRFSHPFPCLGAVDLSWSIGGDHLANAEASHYGGIWRTQQGLTISDPLVSFGGYGDVWGVAWSQDGSAVASTGREVVVIWRYIE
ncbi:MAG: hypothetical protein PVF70_05715 [Anaerolineales bacterium]